ncbi:nickel transporter permease [Bacillus sp. B1-b2]|uniref:nickel transporter permease n=1 Tax=Bacillus sp. B1-b2 TaxID=2653201 RepID=UPI001261B4CA|nr:nickel transporter permease [Bacillus sp. B1-b2]KAB7667125.1 ABC transporter permease subunit [Bacillus sp. B1-b2]
MRHINQILKRTHYWIGWSGFLFIVLIIGLLFSPLFLPHDPYQVDMAAKLQAPSINNWLGTDGLGRDLLTRLLTGGRITLGTSLLVLLGIIAIGVPIGLLSGYIGGRIDRLFMRLADAFLAFPDFLVAIVLTGILGPHIVNLMIAIMAVKWISYARIVRNAIRMEKNKDYIAIAKLNGVGTFRLIRKHLLPHAMRHVLVLMPLDMGKVILMIASFSYLGLGIQPPEAEWGSMLNEGKLYFQQSPYLMILPGLAIMLTVTMANLMGDRVQSRIGYSTRT